MRILLMAILLAATSAFAGAAGNPPEPEVKAAVEKCLAEKEKASAAPETCIGVYTEACLGKSDALSTQDMMACNSKEADVWEERLNREYQVLMKTMKSPAKERVRDLERAWIVFREKKCAYRQMEDEGTVGMILNIACYREETARQALFLNGILDQQDDGK